MNGLRQRCSALLGNTPDAADLHAAEAFLHAVLAERDEPSTNRFGEPWACPRPEAPEDPATRHRILTALAPSLLLDGVWLARVAFPASAHRPSEGHLLALYCHAAGLDDPSAAPASRFRAKLTLEGARVPPLASLFHDPELPAFALALPCAHLGLSHRPRRFLPELLGYTLAHVHREPAWWDAPADPAHRDAARALARAAVDAYPQREAQSGRIRAGWEAYRRLFAELAGNLGAWAAQTPTAEAAMARVIGSKRAEAIGYHRRVLLQGRGLDEWLDQPGDDLRPLLLALRESPYVAGNCPAASRLLRAMEFGGPMFGVFDAEERRVCAAWIEGREMLAPTASSGFPSSAWESMKSAKPAAPRTETRAPHPHARRRRLFAALLRAESPGDCPPDADALVATLLRRVHWLMPLQRGHRRYFAYTPERFHQHIAAVHHGEVGRYRPLSGPPPVSRDYCRWAALQLAPAILVDGAWLAGIGGAAENLGAIDRHLLAIYADELGRGRADWNHPNVYRRLLDSLDIPLPDIDGEAFAANPLFLDAAFDIPVYLLAMGLRADRYFPELLGLNLAIELSGLGAGYMRVIDILRYYGLDPAIIQLHLSIDNPASGHTARAREAIDLYLEDIRRRLGADAVESQWRRIWSGYLSLNQTALGLVIQLLWKYLKERWAGRNAAMAA